MDGIHILHKGECSIESSDAGPDSHRPGESDSPGPGSSAPRNLKPQRQYGVLVNQSSDEHGLPLLSLSKHAPRRSVELASCGPRTVFGEELATGVHTLSELPAPAESPRSKLMPVGVLMRCVSNLEVQSGSRARPALGKRQRCACLCPKLSMGRTQGLRRGGSQCA